MFSFIFVYGTILKTKGWVTLDGRTGKSID